MALYLPSDPFHARAAKRASGFTQGMPFTLLVELELQNGIRRAVASKITTLQECDRILGEISRDERNGYLVRANINQTSHQTSHYAKARELSKLYAPKKAVRTLDILHVAAALLLEAKQFATFDTKQADLAKAAGLGILDA
jgi:hypothetical protein